MREQHIAYIYINARERDRLNKGYGYLANMNAALWEEFLRRYAHPIHEMGPCTVYELGEPT